MGEQIYKVHNHSHKNNTVWLRYFQLWCLALTESTSPCNIKDSNFVYIAVRLTHIKNTSPQIHFFLHPLLCLLPWNQISTFFFFLRILLVFRFNTKPNLYDKILRKTDFISDCLKSHTITCSYRACLNLPIRLTGRAAKITVQSYLECPFQKLK